MSVNVGGFVKRIKGVAFVLDNVEVKGRQNLDMILGAIQELEKIAAQLDQSLKEMEPKKPEIELEVVPAPTEDESK